MTPEFSSLDPWVGVEWSRAAGVSALATFLPPKSLPLGKSHTLSSLVVTY